MGGPPPRVSYDPSQVGRLLKKVGWSRQKPARQAQQQDPQAVANWQTERRTILYVDESACYLLPFVAHSWALCGQIPLLLEQAGRAHLSLIAAISPRGRLYLAGQDQPFTSEDVTWFLGKLCWQYRRQNMLIIWDGAAIHRSQVVRSWLQSRPGRVHLERLPAYGPMLNPVELVWSQLKRSLKNRIFTNLQSLQAAVMNEVAFLQADRIRFRCFFRKKEVAFFTD